MISDRDVATAFKKVHSDLEVKEIYDFDKNTYMICAMDGDDDYNAPYYLMNKATGTVRAFSPLENLDAFSKALQRGLDGND